MKKPEHPNLCYHRVGSEQCFIPLRKREHQEISHIGLSDVSAALEMVEKEKIELCESVLNNQLILLSKSGGKSGIYDDEDEEKSIVITYECQTCDFQTTDLNDHLTHINSHDSLYCMECDLDFDDEIAINTHRECQHIKSNVNECLIRVADDVNATTELVNISAIAKDETSSSDKGDAIEKVNNKKSIAEEQVALDTAIRE